MEYDLNTSLNICSHDILGGQMLAWPVNFLRGTYRWQFNYISTVMYKGYEITDFARHPNRVES